MDQKKKYNLKEQMQFKLFDDPPGSYLDDLEDILDPEDNGEKSVVVKQIGWAECFHCKQPVSVCSKCHIEFVEGDYVHCVDTGENHPDHCCDKCAQKWMITEKGKRYLKSYKLCAHTG